jgi:hypothetical protein
VAEAAELAGLCSPKQPHLDPKEFAVQDISHVGTGDRVGVDTGSPYGASIKKTKCRANANICKYKSYVGGAIPAVYSCWFRINHLPICC